jgi:hypothetical protein
MKNIDNVYWKVIKNYPKYLISSSGELMSFMSNKPIILNPVITNSGYKRVGIYNDDGCRIHFVHRLVAEHHLDKANKNVSVNHKDGNKLNNNVSNLEWCTHSENMVHAVKTGLLSDFGRHGLMEKLNPLQVSIIKRSHSELGTKYLSGLFNVGESCIIRILNGTRQKRHYFGKWENQKYYM